MPLISALATSPNFADDGTILAGSIEDGVFCSMDRSVQAAWNFGLLDLHVLCMWRYRQILVAMKPFLWAPRRGCFAALTADTPVLDVALSQDYAVDAMIFVGTEAAGLLCSTDKGRTWARLGQEVLTDSANKIILARGSSNSLCLLVMQDEALLMSRDGGVSWTNRLRRELLLDGVIALSAPCGLDIDSPLLVGLASGHILHG